MSERVHREFRRQANQVANQTVSVVAPAIQAALENEKLTRARVDILEDVFRRPFFGRVKWLILGR